MPCLFVSVVFERVCKYGFYDCESGKPQTRKVGAYHAPTDNSSATLNVCIFFVSQTKPLEFVRVLKYTLKGIYENE